MSGPEPDALRARWSTLDIEPRYSGPFWNRVKYLDMAAVVAAQPFGLTDDGLIDLRGFTVEPCNVRPATISAATLAGANLHGLNFEEQRWENVVVHDAVLTSSLFSASRLERVSFRRTDLRDTGLSTGYCDYVDCEFDQVRSTRLSLGTASFVGCVFRGLQGRVESGASTFERCRFVGTLHDFEFRNGWESPRGLEKARHNTMRDVDVSEAVLSWVGFYGLDLSEVIRDPSRQIRCVPWEPIRQRLRELFEGGHDPGGAFGDLSFFSEGQRDFIVDLGWVSQKHGADVLPELWTVLEQFGVEKPEV